MTNLKSRQYIFNVSPLAFILYVQLSYLLTQNILIKIAIVYENRIGIYFELRQQ